MTTDQRIIRNRREVKSIISNAEHMLDFDAEHGEFQAHLRSREDFHALVKSLRKNFKFLCDMGVYYFLYVVDEKVLDHDEFIKR